MSFDASVELMNSSKKKGREEGWTEPQLEFDVVVKVLANEIR